MLMVTRLDRLARSTRDLLNILYTLGERGVGFKSLVDSWADTWSAARDHAGRYRGIERELIRARTGEGRTRAKARGVCFCRPPVLPSISAKKLSSALWRALRRLIWREPTA
jgi:DNA invertase Pin-like site-specific DNA recombinase